MVWVWAIACPWGYVQLCGALSFHLMEVGGAELGLSSWLLVTCFLNLRCGVQRVRSLTVTVYFSTR